MLERFAEPGWLLLAVAVIALGGWLVRRALRERRPREAAATVLRGLILVLLVVALAGWLRDAGSRHVDVVFALDVSQSIDRETVAEGLAFFNRALAAKAPASHMGLVVFAADAGVEAVMSGPAEPVRALSVEVRRGHTDIGRGLEAALAALPAGGQRRVVLLSDGRENLGRARPVAAIAATMGVEVHAVALEPNAAGNEVRVQDVVAPARVRVHEPFQLEVLLHSRHRTRAHLVVMRNANVIAHAELDLEPGTNVHSLVEQLAQPGLLEYEAVVNADADAVQENNRYQAFVEVLGPPKVLHLVGEPGWGRHVGAALRAQGIAVEERPGDALPATLHGLADYDLVILNDISGFDISLEKMRRLEEYVRDAGGGLVALGGHRSYGGGGYYGTPIERVLPVAMDVESEAQIPTVAVTVVLDRSGSMASDEKLFIAKSAALAAIEVLSPLDEVSVLAFDDAPQWLVPPTLVGNRRAIVERLRPIGAGGGTNLYVALEEARRATLEQQARVKHLIVLSDGLTETDADFEDLVRRLVEDGVTVSTVAFGRDADQALLESIAAWGRGRYYFTADPRDVPRILTGETLVVARDLHVEKDVVPVLGFAGELLEGFAPGAFPVLRGYQRASAKPLAQVLLAADGDDPLLVAWRYGLGRSVAFLSDLDRRWGREWTAWPRFGQFVGQLARWTMRRRGEESMVPSFSWEGLRGEMLVDVLDRDDRFVNRLAMSAVVIGPEREPVQIALEQVGPGRYRGEFPVSDSGRYYVSLSGASADVRVGPRTFGLAVPYSAEHVHRGADLVLLRGLAEATGGALRAMTPQALDAILAPDPAAVAGSARLWWPFLLAALALLVLDVAVRKVRLPEAWAARWRRLPAARASPPDPGYDTWVRELAAARESHLAALRLGHAYENEDPAVRARLHIARGGRR